MNNLRAKDWFIRSLMLLVFMGVATLFIAGGMQAINDHYYESQWEYETSFAVGPWGNSNRTTGVDRYTGSDAMRIGIGYIAFGGLAGWMGLAVAWNLFQPSRLRPRKTMVAAFCTVYLALQTILIICMYPPWQLEHGRSPAFYATLMLIALWTGRHLARQYHWLPRVPCAIKKLAFIAALLSIAVCYVIAGLQGPRSGQGVIVAVFVAISYAVVLIVFATTVMEHSVDWDKLIDP